MEPVIFVEVLDRRGRVASRHRVDHWPATIGRAYTNDVILDDPYVCPRHLRLVRGDDGTVTAQDLDSVNGTYRDPERRRISALPLDDETRLRLGHTIVRVRRLDLGVPPALPLGGRWGATLFTRTPIALAWCFGVPLAVGANMWLETYERTRPWELAGFGIVLTVVVLLWSGAWAMVNRLVGHGWNFLAHVAVASAFMVISLPVDMLERYVSFLSERAWPAIVASDVLSVATLGWLFAMHLALIGTLGTGRRLRAALAAAIALVAIGTLLGRWQATRFSTDIEFDATLMPFPPGWTRAHTPEVFVAQVSQLEREVESLARNR